MSQPASELGALLVEDVYGELTSLLFRILLRHGRLSLPALRHHTCLSDRLVKHGLSVLVQHQLVLWYTTDKNWTTYEASPEAAYLLARSGKYVKIAEDRVSKFAGDIVSNLLALGHARVGDLVQAYGIGNGKITNKSSHSVSVSDKRSANGSEAKADSNGADDITLDKIHETLDELLSFGLVSEVNISHFRSDADNRIEAEKVVPPVEHYKAKSKRENEAQWELSVVKKLVDWKNGLENETIQVNGMNRGKKRTREDVEGFKPEKRQRLDRFDDNDVTGATYQIGAAEGGFLDDTAVLRINHIKFAVFMRNDYLIDLAERLICTGTSNVYSEVLRALEPKMEVFEEEKDVTDGLGRDRDLSFLPQISTDDLVLIVKETDELAKALGPVDASAIDLKEPDHPKKRRKKEKDTNDEAMVDGAASSDEDESDSDSDDDDSAVSIDSEEPDSEAEYAEHNLDILSNFPGDPHRATIRNHLLLLARHPHKFLHHFPQTHMIPERWTVNFPSMMNKAAHQTIMQIITSRYGLPARRLAQVLSEQGKVGERELIATCFLGQKPMRSHLAKLHAAGLIHIQEVPRDNSRAPHRTMFLWYIDMEKCKSKLVEETFKIMARCLQRAKLEGAKVKTLLEKANRSDVIGKEEQFLTIQEREALEDWRAMEEKFWGEMARLDEVVAVLRDY